LDSRRRQASNRGQRDRPPLESSVSRPAVDASQSSLRPGMFCPKQPAARDYWRV
jgi:hypothetical protein